MRRVWVNGTFDVLHIGHIKLLEYAASLGQLRVGIDTDERVKELKGQDRPFNNTEDRVVMLMALKSVNDVKTFSSRQEMFELIKDWSPDYMIVGSDYKDKEIIGSEYVKQVIYFERLKDKSTTNILNYGKRK
jgi:D-beta-D-heptose 7-phosphate kinase/D-beta-D-heptose 1-phosphate adenosyltransferase